MGWNERRFVQFPHPGGEHRPDPASRKPWHRHADGDHRRKFLSLNGRWWTAGREQSGTLHAWGEWEAQSILVRRLPGSEAYPHYLWQPYYAPQDDYTGLHNTDPFIYGGFFYGNCKQGTSASLKGLKHLGDGSVIVFGKQDTTGVGCRHRARRTGPHRLRLRASQPATRRARAGELLGRYTGTDVHIRLEPVPNLPPLSRGNRRSPTRRHVQLLSRHSSGARRRNIRASRHRTTRALLQAENDTGRKGTRGKQRSSCPRRIACAVGSNC
jgi:hypothetical protein